MGKPSSLSCTIAQLTSWISGTLANKLPASVYAVPPHPAMSSPHVRTSVDMRGGNIAGAGSTGMHKASSSVS